MFYKYKYHFLVALAVAGVAYYLYKNYYKKSEPSNADKLKEEDKQIKQDLVAKAKSLVYAN